MMAIFIKKINLFKSQHIIVAVDLGKFYTDLKL